MRTTESTRLDRPRFSVVVPVYNEIESLPTLLDELGTSLAPYSGNYELVFVDDGSSDDSAAFLEHRAQVDPHVRLFRLERNAGQTAAFLAGFARVRSPVVVTIDADGQNPPAEIPRVVEALTDEVDVVAGYRARRQDTRWKKLQSRIANRVRNALTGETIRDTGCSLKAFRVEFLEHIPAFDGMHRFLPTLCRLAGASRVVEIAVDHRPRAAGQSKYTMSNRALRALKDLFAVRWMQRRFLDYRVMPTHDQLRVRPAAEAADISLRHGSLQRAPEQPQKLDH